MTWVTLAAALAVAPSGQAPSPPQADAKLVRVFVHTVDGGEASELKNKNKPVESQLGWKSAADDIAKQIEKWVTDRRTAILAAR